MAPYDGLHKSVHENTGEQEMNENKHSVGLIKIQQVIQPGERIKKSCLRIGDKGLAAA